MQVIDGNDPQAAQAALASVSLMTSQDARMAIADIADNHSDKGLRALATIALGRQIGHDHH